MRRVESMQIVMRQYFDSSAAYDTVGLVVAELVDVIVVVVRGERGETRNFGQDSGSPSTPAAQ
jgi:hypothetical protein